MKLTFHIAAFTLVSFCLAGCGGEDFSTPPPGLANVRAKSAPKAESDTDEAAIPHADSLAEAVSNDSQSGQQPESITTELPGVRKADGTGPSADTVKLTTNDQPAIAAESAEQPASVLKGVAVGTQDDAVVTVGGKSTAQVEASKDRKESAAAAGMSLLDKLKTDDVAKEKVARRGTSPAARQVMTQTGRNAIAAEAWYRLRNQLAKRFYVAATQDGRRIAASFGASRLAVLDTQVMPPLPIPTAVPMAARMQQQRLLKPDVTTRYLSNLPGTISCLEFIPSGNVVLAGTEDGRVIARSNADLTDWDLYAQDLFAWQDEHANPTRVSDASVVVLKTINDQRLLTVDGGGVCKIWEMAQVVHPPVSPLDITEAQAKSPETKTTTAKPLHTVELPRARVLSLKICGHRAFGVAVTKDEVVTVFDTASGQVLQSITAAQLDDTQPVCGIVNEQLKQILVGLADGRIFKLALPGGDAVKGVDEDGNDTNFQIVFAPEAHDRDGAVTSLELNDDRTLLYFGRSNGTLATFDLKRSQIQQTEKLHNSPVADIFTTPAGLFSIADNRLAKLSHIPVVAGHNAANQTLQLPVDSVLNSKELVERDELMPGQRANPRPIVRANPNLADVDESLSGLRPADPVLALYEHQLRVAKDSATQDAIRQKIFGLKPEREVAVDKSYDEVTPVKTGELQSEFDFQSRPLQRVVMSVSNDGAILATAQARRSLPLRAGGPTRPVAVWDVATETKLRTWQVPGELTNLVLEVNSGSLFSEPFYGRMRLSDGRLVTDQSPSQLLTRPVLFQMSPQSTHLAIGMAGAPGTAGNVVQMVGVTSDFKHEGIDAFEGVTSAMAWSPDGGSLFVAVRERTQCRLLELESPTLQVRSEIDAERMEGAWNVDAFDPHRSIAGATHLLPSPDGKLLVTYGHHTSRQSPYQIRFWQKSKDGWPQEDVKVVDSQQPMLETEMTATPMVFVDQQSSQLAVIGSKGFAVLDARTGSLQGSQPLPNVDDRRPAAVFSPDGKWALAGDREGNVWVWELSSLNRPPRHFAAQAGPITGLAMSPNARFLVTIGEENRIRTWDVSAFLNDAERSTRKSR
ncbi:hypothetical protein [Fuerstiella marisgermanici]|uniref:WD domain, G-beta repeat n=1 Tax=Fuerstiella marisgermanici TaxID=1891926 RepID=A0A1P8WJR8_9PLAN|nr:hypothetical protein [Fuerstiella marisgermanici]APZ94299.1 WD domain, G-beta repeat [Fuerstiella marisgermanici]